MKITILNSKSGARGEKDTTESMRWEQAWSTGTVPAGYTEAVS